MNYWKRLFWKAFPDFTNHFHAQQNNHPNNQSYNKIDYEAGDTFKQAVKVINIMCEDSARDQKKGYGSNDRKAFDDPRQGTY